jgi:hypothetical protein
MSIEPLLVWNRMSGEHYGSEDQSIFFYSYVKMQRPKTVLELGTGLGHTALWVAQALKENDRGHIWTVDNGARWPEVLRAFSQRPAPSDDLRESHPGLYEIFARYFTRGPTAWDGQHHEDYFDCMTELASALSLSSFISFLDGTMSLTDTATVDSDSVPFLTPALERPIDLLYSDFDHYPHAILTTLTKYLPLMSPCSSIFIDSASTHLPSYLALEHTIDQLNRGKIPAIFLAGTKPAQQDRLAEIVATRRFIHLALPERKDRNQNGLTWIRIEPVNIVPYPLTQMRGFFAGPLSGDALACFFEGGSLPPEQLKKAFLFEQFVRAAYPLGEDEIRFLISLMAGREA